MGIEPFLVASTLNLVIGQRLVRKICSYCRKERKVEAQYLKSLEEQWPEIEKFNLEKAKFYYGEGCQNCDGTGYIGRIGIFEVLSMSSAVREAVSRKFTSTQIKEIAREEGMTTMLEDGFKKVISGITTIEEVLRVMHE
jgi:type II secretory ATPase GspE/PulE/Tfp pilus assembly ATPase PilB-like protein